jgi:hypothetical protein
MHLRNGMPLFIWKPHTKMYGLLLRQQTKKVKIALGQLLKPKGKNQLGLLLHFFLQSIFFKRKISVAFEINTLCN